MAASVNYLVQYLQDLETLPVELQRNLALLRDLDHRTQLVLQEIDKFGGEFLKIVGEASKEEKNGYSKKMQKLFKKARDYGDDKVQLATQIYALVDKHVARLDCDLARYESQIKNRDNSPSPPLTSEAAPPTPIKRGRKLEKEPIKRGRGRPKSCTDKGQGRRNSCKKRGRGRPKSCNPTEPGSSKACYTGAATSPATMIRKIAVEQVVSSTTAFEDEQDDEPDLLVDPNEPKYCLCNQVSYGNMIACDNAECDIEWFHVECMQLSAIPKGKWYCPKCLRKK